MAGKITLAIVSLLVGVWHIILMYALLRSKGDFVNWNFFVPAEVSIFFIWLSAYGIYKSIDK